MEMRPLQKKKKSCFRGKNKERTRKQGAAGCCRVGFDGALFPLPKQSPCCPHTRGCPARLHARPGSSHLRVSVGFSLWERDFPYARLAVLVPTCVSASVFFYRFHWVSTSFACCATSQRDTLIPANKCALRELVTRRQTPIKMSRFYLGHLCRLLNSCGIFVSSMPMCSQVINSGCNPALAVTRIWVAPRTFWCCKVMTSGVIKYTLCL